ncbi:MAG: DUF1294 domain-containing protein, partial [Thaumarchaeota archaeon]|nr:DUF1294 domain-containing protein [Nitrososphaerota archaeon]
MVSWDLVMGLTYWISFFTLIALIFMGFDKISSKLQKRRVNEGSLWILSLIGGFPGIILGALLFHHKLKKKRFWIPVV